MSLVHERPVKRCPKTGYVELYRAWSGYCPTGERSGWILVAIAVAVVAVARLGFGL
jgi:hypothetical protein